jgi:tetratricopeptide (TPR) repeat protein
LGGVFYYLKTKPPVVLDTNTTEENIENLEEKALNPDPKEVTVKKNEEENKNKFNTAIKDARTAFGKEDYETAINKYNLALTYKNSDIAYIGLFTIYGAQNDWIKAQAAIDNAIKINPSYTDYWNSKLDMLSEKIGYSFQSLKEIYTQGLSKVDGRTKINLVTHFARIAENNNEKEEAIKLWQYAIEIYPQNKDIYQKEIDALK